MPTKLKLIFAYLGVITIWSTTPLSIQWSGQTDWFFGLASRILISGIIAMPLVFIPQWLSKKNSNLSYNHSDNHSNTGTSPEAFSLSPTALKIYFAAALGMFGGMTPIYYAAQTMPSGWISLIFGTTPIMIGALAWLVFKNLTMTLHKVLGIVLSISGLTLVILPHSHLTTANAQNTPLILGVGLAFCGVFFHSLSTLLVKKYHAQLPELPSLHIVAGTAWICSIAYLALNPHYLLEWPNVPTKSLAAIIYLGTFGSLLGFIFYYYLLRHLHAIQLGFITLITPMMALLLGHFLNNEPLNSRIALGAGLVISGLIWYEFGSKIQHQLHKHLQ